MKSGARPTRIKHLDYDFLKSHGFGAATPPIFPAEYLTDAGLTMPDQNADGQPYGCTNETQADVATDLTGQIHNIDDLEAVTHANTNGGCDIRVSLDAARKTLKWFSAYYNIRGSGLIDFFDAFRLAQLSASPDEKRSISWGTPWFPSWEAAIQGNLIQRQPNGSYTLIGGQPKAVVMPMPTDDELATVQRNPNAYPWHNSKLDGWTNKHNGVLTYRDKSWQGPNIGEGGFVYFPREVINVVMTIKGTVAYTASRLAPTDPQRIDVTIAQLIVSIIRHFLGL